MIKEFSDRSYVTWRYEDNVVGRPAQMVSFGSAHDTISHLTGINLGYGVCDVTVEQLSIIKKTFIVHSAKILLSEPIVNYDFIIAQLQTEYNCAFEAAKIALITALLMNDNNLDNIIVQDLTLIRDSFSSDSRVSFRFISDEIAYFLQFDNIIRSFIFELLQLPIIVCCDVIKYINRAYQGVNSPSIFLFNIESIINRQFMILIRNTHNAEDVLTGSPVTTRNSRITNYPTNDVIQALSDRSRIAAFGSCVNDGTYSSIWRESRRTAAIRVEPFKKPELTLIDIIGNLITWNKQKGIHLVQKENCLELVKLYKHKFVLLDSDLLNIDLRDGFICAFKNNYEYCRLFLINTNHKFNNSRLFVDKSRKEVANKYTSKVEVI